MNYELKLGDNLETLKNYPDNHFDSIVTDPPYGIEFLGKDWDSHTGVLELWQECLRVLKPGGYLLAFSAARTYHQLASNIELAGFEIRDQLMWLYASGFPKAQDIGKAIQKRIGVDEYEKFVDTTLNAGFGQTDHARVRAGVEWSTPATSVGSPKVTSPIAQQWEGFKTALKPAHEPIVMARKPFKGSTIDNVLKNGLGALNIDATRIERDLDDEYIDRYPCNVIGEVEEGYQKYFYCPKVSRKERHIGFGADTPLTEIAEARGCTKIGGNLWKLPDNNTCADNGLRWNLEKLFGPIEALNVGNNHPTVKPVALMDYLIKLVTPPSTPTLQRKVLDPFMGSGSTGMAATALGHHFTGCELDPKYVAIAGTRIEAWNAPEVDNSPQLPSNLFEITV
jgi:DNA modification methylase